MSMANQLKLIIETVPLILVSETVTLFHQKGFVVCILNLWGEVWGPCQKKRAEESIISRDTNSTYFKLLFEEFNIRKHFEIVDDHKRWVTRTYERLAQHVPHVSKEDIERHDLSKYSMAQAIGYTAKWVHGVEWSSPEWQEALKDHYQKEKHHPEYFHKGRMSQSALEESLVDMLACRWERVLGGRDDVTTEELLDIQPHFLERYCKEDRDAVRKLIDQILDTTEE